MESKLKIEIPKVAILSEKIEDVTGKKRERLPEVDNGLKHTKPKKAKNAGVHS